MALRPEVPSAAAEDDAGLFDPAFLQSLETLALASRRRVQGVHRGERRSIARGRGVEFADYRPYEPGDDYRYIDWHIASRLDRLVVKMFTEEEDLQVHLLVDASASMLVGTPPKLALARRLAAAIGYIALVNLDRVTVSAVTSAPGPSLGALRGRRRAVDLFQFLAGVRGGGATDLGGALRRLLWTARRGSLLVLFSDLLDPHGYERALREALYHRCSVFLVHILAEEEIAPPLAGDVRLVDVETGESVEITADPDTLRLYAEAVEEFTQGVERFCARCGIDYLRTLSSVPAEVLVTRYLRQGGLLE
jgi:uncharacterized protein (DUF58 family)